VSIYDIEATANEAHFAARFTSATYTPPSGVGVSARIDIDRSAKVVDERGFVQEDRCEVSLIVSEVGPGERGAEVDTGRPGDVWLLLEPIGNDGWEARWIAGRS
jgi:hypothetical protein